MFNGRITVVLFGKTALDYGLPDFIVDNCIVRPCDTWAEVYYHLEGMSVGAE